VHERLFLIRLNGSVEQVLRKLKTPLSSVKTCQNKDCCDSSWDAAVNGLFVLFIIFILKS